MQWTWVYSKCGTTNRICQYVISFSYSTAATSTKDSYEDVCIYRLWCARYKFCQGCWIKYNYN